MTFRAYAPADVLLVLMQNGGAAQGVGDGGGGTSLLDMCYQTILLLGGEKGGMLAAKDNPQSFQRKLRVRARARAPCLAVPSPRRVSSPRGLPRASHTTWTPSSAATASCTSRPRRPRAPAAREARRPAPGTAPPEPRQRVSRPPSARPAARWCRTRLPLSCGES